jgi:NTE family protein
MSECTPALVLSGGGARGAYQVGVLRHIARHHPELNFKVITGVSAGAINATFVAGHAGSLGDAADELADHWLSLATSRVIRSDAFSLSGNALRVLSNVATGGSSLAPPIRGLVDTSPLRRFLTDVLPLHGIERNVREGRLRALAISATSYRSGESVTFVQGVDDVSMWTRVRRRARAADVTVDHVMASAAIPLFFPACAVDGEFYGDGSLRQSYPLAPAIHLGADRLLAVSSRYDGGREGTQSVETGYPTAARVFGLMLNSIFLNNLDVDAERLDRINRLLDRIDESKRWLVAERQVDLLVLRPSRDIGRIAAGYEKRFPRGLRYFIRGLGTRRLASSDLLSYLMFERDYLEELISLGERDAGVNRAKIARFVEGCMSASPVP